MYGSTPPPPGVLPAPGERGIPLYKPYRYVPHPRVGFLRRFGLKTGIHLNYFRLESSMIFKGIGNYGSVWTYLSFHSKWVRKKEKYANSKWILRNLLCCCSNFQFLRDQVWKRVWILEARPENGCEKWHLMVWDKLWHLLHLFYPHKIPEITSEHRWQGRRPVHSVFAFFFFLTKYLISI